MLDSGVRKDQKGFIPVMLMPFNENGEVDYDGLTKITEFYLESGAVGLFANCLSSEMFDLSPEERLKTTKHVLKIAGGAVPVVATGNFGKRIADQAEFIKRMHDTGVDAVIVVTSLLAGEEESNEALNENTMQLIDLTGNIPLGFYECPFPYKRILDSGQLRLFLETNRLVYYKDTCLDIEKIRSKIEVSRGFDLRLYDAYIGHAVASLRSGTDGLSCIQGNFFPEVIVWLCQNYDNPDLRTEVDTVQQFLIDNMDVMHAVYPPVAKYFLQKRGFKITTFSRVNGAVLTDTVRNQIDTLFDSCEKLKSELNI